MGVLDQTALQQKAKAQKDQPDRAVKERAREVPASPARGPAIPPDHQHSGTEVVPLGTLGPHSRVTKAALKVSGEAFSGKVACFAGTQVTASPVVHGAKALPVGTPEGQTTTAAHGQQGFIVDFGGMRSLLAVRFDSPAITMVLPWMGTGFSETPLFPVPKGTAGTPPTVTTSVARFSGVDTQKLFVQVAGTSVLTVEDFSKRCSLETTTVPTNVRASVAGRLPFWTHPGPLTDEVPVTGLVDDLDAAVAELDEDVAVAVDIATDTPGVIHVTFAPAADLKVANEARASWGGSPELAVEVSSLAPAPVTIVWPAAAAVPPWLLDELTVDLEPAFPPWRAVPAQTPDAPGPLGLRVSAQFSVARRVTFEEEVLLHGVGLPVRVASDSAVVVELTPGDATAPGSGAPIASAELAAGASADPQWVEVLFASPVAVPPGDVWIVAKSRRGDLEWAAAKVAGTEQASRFSDQGARFEAYPALGGDEAVAQLRILRAPLPSENVPVLEVTVPGASPAAVSGAGAETLTFALGQPRELAPGPAGMTFDVELLPRSTGTVTLRGAVAVYREKTS